MFRLIVSALTSVFALASSLMITSAACATPSWILNPDNGHSYRFTTSAGTWSSAEQEAINVGGHLASIGDADENMFLLQNFIPPAGERSEVWIGLVNDNAWTDGTPFTYSNWAAMEPNSSIENGTAELAKQAIDNCSSQTAHLVSAKDVLAQDLGYRNFRIMMEQTELVPLSSGCQMWLTPDSDGYGWHGQKARSLIYRDSKAAKKL